MKNGMAAGLLVTGLGLGIAFGQAGTAFVVQASVPLYAGVAAFPRVVAGEGATPEIAAHLNAGFARLDARVAAAAAQCRKTAQKARRRADPTAWQRTMEVTMAGPRYVSVLATDADDCGQTQPHTGVVLPLVYDLATGAPANWVKLLPAGVRASTAVAEDGTPLGTIEWPVLQARTVKEATPECKELIRETGFLDFAVWLDGAKGTVVAETVSFPNAGAACEVPIRLSSEELRQMGSAKELVYALDLAKAGAAR